MITSRDFQSLRGNLVGISDRLLRDHLTLYQGYVDDLNAIEREYPLVDWTRPRDGQSSAPPGIARLLDMRIGDLKLAPEGVMAELIASTLQETRSAGIAWAPTFYLGDDGFWTADRATSINLPWFLANPTLWWLVNERRSKYTVEELARALRHEVGHALNYAFELWKTPEWMALFGDFEEPYKSVYLADPTSTDYVRYLHRTGDRHYAQKHPDEDWAETFACWLDPRPSVRVGLGPLAQRKVAYVAQLIASGALSGPPKVTTPGETRPYTQLRQTIGAYLGEDRPGAVWSPHAELMRREPFAYNAVVLHESYFEAMGGAGQHGTGPLITTEAARAFGAVDSWLTDLRAACGATKCGWALTVWDARRQRLANVLVEDHRTGTWAGCLILSAIDLWEHSYTSDYGLRKDAYLAAVFTNMDWALIDQRLRLARPTP